MEGVDKGEKFIKIEIIVISSVMISPKSVCVGGYRWFALSPVGGQNKSKFAHIVCIKMEDNSQRRKILLFLSTNMAVMMSCTNHQYARNTWILVGIFSKKLFNLQGS